MILPIPPSTVLEDGWDEETSLLFARLNLEDIQNIQASRKGKGRIDAPASDEELAFAMEAASLQSLLRAFEDRQFSRSLDSALRSDREALDACSAIERGERDDHLAALACSRGEVLPRPSEYQQSLEKPRNTEHVPDKTELLSFETAHPHRSTTRHRPVDLCKTSVVTQLPVRVDLECTICMDKCDTLSMYHSPCGHPYCTDCLVDLVEASTRDESLHPLRCCKQHFVTEDVASRLTLNLRSRFYTKSIEFNTPPSSRIYCPKKTCSAFLGASGRSSNIICPTCKTGVCCQCKNAAHPGNACDEDTEVLQVKALARKELWQTCPGCYAIIELSQGCFHMTCTACRSEFCYLCAQYWKSCSCLHWEESRLLSAAQHRVENQFGAAVAAAQPVLHAERVGRVAAILRDDHDCIAHRWRYQHGGGMCEECNHYLHTFLMRCTNCQILACKRCTRNRL